MPKMIMSDADIIAEFKQAKNPAEQVKILADENLVTHDAMAAYLADLLGDQFHVRKPRSSFDKDKALELYDAGATDDEIAAALGVAKGTVINWRNRSGSMPANRKSRAKKEEVKPDPEEIKAVAQEIVEDLTPVRGMNISALIKILNDTELYFPNPVVKVCGCGTVVAAELKLEYDDIGNYSRATLILICETEVR